MNKSIQAFTIVEMLIVMILSAVVSALLYQSVLSISSLYHHFEKRQQQLQEITRYYTMLQKDIFSSERLTIGQNRLSFLANEKQVVYKITPNTLIRESGTDVDSISLLNVELSCGGCDTTAMSFCAVLTFIHQEELVRWQFNKRYSNAQLFKTLARHEFH